MIGIYSVHGQELNGLTRAIVQSDLMVQDAAPERMRNSNSLCVDVFPFEKLDYLPRAHHTVWTGRRMPRTSARS